MPPRHGKSELFSHWLPTWFLTRWPTRRVMEACYEADFAASWGRKVRNTIGENGATLGLRLAADSAAASRWELTAGGGMVTAGVGGPFTGKGGDLLLVDDPIKNAEEASSEVYRDKLWDWWKSTAYTRLEPGGTVIVVMTRWHEDDLVGRLLRDQEERWEVIRFPAIAEEDDVLGRRPGDALWPARYPASVLRQIEKDVGSYYYAGMYGQRPAPREGGMLKREWFEIVERAPRFALRFRVWDLAATEKKKKSQDPDWTVGVLLAFLDGVLYIEHMVRLRATSNVVERVILQTAKADGREVVQWFQQDPGQAGKAQIAALTRLLWGFAVKSEPKTGDKVLWAEPLAAQAGQGNVKLVAGPWVTPFLDEACAFPNGAHDDMVDATSWGLSRFEGGGRRLWGADAEQEDERREPDRWRGFMPNRPGVEETEDDEDDELGDQ